MSNLLVRQQQLLYSTRPQQPQPAATTGGRVRARGHVRAASAPVLKDESGRNPIPKDLELPLLHKRVMLTAPRQYAWKLSAKLLQAGARPLWVPSIAIDPMSPHERGPLDAALRVLLTQPTDHPYTHIAFTSKNGIFATLQRAADLVREMQLGSGADAMDDGLQDAVQALLRSGVQLCALGADGEVLRSAGLPVHVSPPEASTLGLVNELKSTGRAQGANILCPVPLVKSPLIEPKVVPRFLSALEEAGARAERVHAYETSQGTDASTCALERTALETGQVDAIAFSSTAEAQGLKAIFPDIKGAVQAHNILLAAHGPYTAEGVSEVLDVRVMCISQNFRTFDGIVLALEHSFDQLSKDVKGIKLVA